MVWRPVRAAGVCVTEQLALAATVMGSTLPDPIVQLSGLKPPLPPTLVKLTMPLGIVAAPGVPSVTIAVHLVDSPTPMTCGAQPTLVTVKFVKIAGADESAFAPKALAPTGMLAPVTTKFRRRRTAIHRRPSGRRSSLDM